jgi:SAM-dependent methyltransferase
MNAKDYKWLIPSGLTSQYTEKNIWDKDHENYSENIFSLTKDPEVCKALIHPSSQFLVFNIPDSPEIKVLIPGCGSEIYLQKALFEFCPNIGQVCCTDFSETAIDVARKKWKQADGETKFNSQIFFETVDSTQLTQEKPDWVEKFDYILVVNSVVSGEDAINRQMLKEFYNVLKPRGKVYGFFPTIFECLECAYLYSPKASWLTDGSINLPDSAYYDRERNDRQIHYTPLRLNRIFKEAGFKRLSFEVYFGDSDILMESLKQLEGIDDPDICGWEFLVRLEKKLSSSLVDS